MKIAFVVSFFDFRNDVRQVIKEISLDHEVVIFGNKEDEIKIREHLPANVEFRPIAEKRRTLWNIIWERVYLLFKVLPKSRNNYFLMELFKIGNLKNVADRKKAAKILELSKRLPKIVSYDRFIQNLQITRETHIADIDRFVFFTAISNDYFLSRLIDENRRVSVYVYSWDHPCKHTCFSKRVDYLCWSNEIKIDLVNLQNIPTDRISVVGPSQFSYIYSYRTTELQFNPYPFEYIYFGCAIGIADLVPSEIAVIKTLSVSLAKVRPDWKLLLRPYPVLTNWQLYEPLRNLPNIVFDEHFKNKDSSVSESEILRKYDTLDHAQAFFHMGTTMGLEACLTNTVSFIIDFGYTSKSGLSLFNFIHQYQNDRHLIDLSPQNVISSDEHFRQVLNQLHDPEYSSLNKKIEQQYQIKSFKSFANDLIEMT